jgi:hypothetical protein
MDAVSGNPDHAKAARRIRTGIEHGDWKCGTRCEQRLSIRLGAARQLRPGSRSAKGIKRQERRISVGRNQKLLEVVFTISAQEHPLIAPVD